MAHERVEKILGNVMLLLFVYILWSLWFIFLGFDQAKLSGICTIGITALGFALATLKMLGYDKRIRELEETIRKLTKDEK